jgi:hypothetical protein
MIRYKDNSSLKLKVVKTVSGELEYRRNCRKIKDKYYIIGEQCVEINEKWYVTTSKLITYDYELKCYVLLKDTPLVYGVVDVKKDGEVVFGYFTENKYNNVWVNSPNYGSIRAYTEEILKANDYIENISDGVWIYKGNMSAAAIRKMGTIESRKVYKNKGYNIEDNAEEFTEKIDMFAKYPTKISATASVYGRMLGNTTYGGEIETAMGYLPEHIQYRTGVVICRDGSIDNAEYVTVPMAGAKGLVTLKYLASELTKRTTTDIKCSLHYHLGTLPTDRLFIVALWALAIRIQDELFTMFPHYKTKWEGIKRQSYNEKLRKLGTEVLKQGATKEEFTKYVDEGYYRIFTYLNDGHPPDDNFNRNNNRHTQTHKWNRKRRYYWMNFMNMFFSERRTIEFRLHHNTVNGQKMINWLFICNAVVKYAEKHAKEIVSGNKPITVEQVLNYYAETFKTKHGKFLSAYLIAYFKDRVAYFNNDVRRGDFISQKEQDEDKGYVFEYEGTTHLF